MNVAIVLAAGKSTRFLSETPKQLYPLNGKRIIDHSIDLLSKHLDRVIIVTNSDLKDQIEGDLIINDTDSRLESIRVALSSIDHCKKILIHDAARPYITERTIIDLLESSKYNTHSQYVLPLLNGLAKKIPNGYEIPNRSEYIELCSPQITDFETFRIIFENYILPGDECEVLPVISRFGFKYDLIRGHYKYLRKVTTLEDIF